MSAHGRHRQGGAPEEEAAPAAGGRAERRRAARQGGRQGAKHGRKPQPQRGPSASRGRAERRRIAKRVKRRRRLTATRELPILVGMALLIALVLKTFLVQAFVIPSGSMEQTIRIGDRVLVDKLTPWFGWTPERGDVVVFRDPGQWLKDEPPPEPRPFLVETGRDALTFVGLLPSEDEQDLIKRVVAVGGDTVACCDENGRIRVNGTPLDEPYVHPGNAPSSTPFEVEVPPGRVFVLGDHRENSQDSRFHMNDPGRGTVPEDHVVGRAFLIAWPVDHWRRLEEPRTYASVADAAAEAVGLPEDEHRKRALPILAGVPLVVGMAGLIRYPGGRQRGERSRCGGRGGRRTLRFGRGGVRTPRGTRRGERRAAGHRER